jgi:hypothetical protein
MMSKIPNKVEKERNANDARLKINSTRVSRGLAVPTTTSSGSASKPNALSGVGSTVQISETFLQHSCVGKLRHQTTTFSRQDGGVQWVDSNALGLFCVTRHCNIKTAKSAVQTMPWVRQKAKMPCED